MAEPLSRSALRGLRGLIQSQTDAEVIRGCCIARLEPAPHFLLNDAAPMLGGTCGLQRAVLAAEVDERTAAPRGDALHLR